VTAWTADDIPDLTGRIAVVTGANSGLGHQVVIELARHGAHVVLACRDLERGAKAMQDVAGSAELLRLDLADLASVREFTRAFSQEHPRLDLLVCNAGVMATPYRTTADGFELQFGTNHLGHFALTGLVLRQLLAAPSARVVVVSSNLHRIGALFSADLTSSGRYQAWVAYGRSKFANLLFMHELQRRAAAAGTGLLAVGAHPGWAATNLQETGPRMRGSRIGQALARLGNRLLSQPVEMGALPLLRAATDPEARPADFFGPSGLAGYHGPPERAGSSRRARNPQLGHALWEKSERLTGVTYEWTAGR
jgi:NAD(P)-dependent dehydrogenase (short-subunit alcohol dehydrogenase family)